MGPPNYEYSSPIKCDFENTYETSNKISIKQEVKGTNDKTTPAGTFRYTLQSDEVRGCGGSGRSHYEGYADIPEKATGPVEMRARSADEYEGILGDWKNLPDDVHKYIY